MSKPHEQTFEIVIAGLMHRLSVEPDVICRNQAFVLQFGQIEPQRRDVGEKILNTLIEGNEDARFAIVACTLDQKGRAQQSLSAARPAADQRGPSRWQTAAG